MFFALFLCFIDIIISDTVQWKDYPNYDCGQTISALELKYHLTLSQCHNSCSNTTHCKGVSWYQYKKTDVQDSSRCYLLDVVCELSHYTATPAVTSFWSKNITKETQCIDYPISWMDRYADNCDYYAKLGICDDVFNHSSRSWILDDYDTTYNLTAFEACCSCTGSLFDYNPMSSDISYLLESIWKPPHNKDITETMVCQSYNKYRNNTQHPDAKWDINIFLSICDYLTKKAYSKYRNIYSLSTSPMENLQSLHYEQLNVFDCIHDNLFIDDSVTFHLCDNMDYDNYPYIIDISSSHNYSVYLNGYFMDINDFENNLKNNEIIAQTDCKIESLIHHNNESNILAALLCESNITASPTQYPSISPTSPSKHPTPTPTIPNYETIGTMYCDHSDSNRFLEWDDVVRYYDFQLTITELSANVTFSTCVTEMNISLGIIDMNGIEISDAHCDANDCECTVPFMIPGAYYIRITRGYTDFGIYTISTSCDREVAAPTINPTADSNPLYNIIWENIPHYTCNDLIPALDVLYNATQTECHEICLSGNYSMECTATVWYEYVKATGNQVSRCYLFGESCELMIDETMPVTTSFWYQNITNDIDCVDYPLDWTDNLMDNCDAYTIGNWCDYAYNSSTTDIFSYEDSIYGLDALDVCCDCNGGLFMYDNTYLLEPKWKPTTKLNIYEDTNDFLCHPLDFSSTIIDEFGILDEDKWTFTEFVGLCQYLQSMLYDQYKFMLSIDTENNNVAKRTDIELDFSTLKHFNCANSLFLNNVTICNETDYNNLYPFVIDIEEGHMYINNHYIDTETFLYHVPPTAINMEPFCSFSVLLETVYPTHPPTKEPTYEPTIEPTTDPTADPTANPTQPSSHPTTSPSNNPTTEPTQEPTMNPTENPTSEPTNIPTSDPTKDPTTEPTEEPTLNPTADPTSEPTKYPTSSPSIDPTNEPTEEPTINPTRYPSSEPTKYPTSTPTRDPTEDPTTEPTKDPTNEPTTEPTKDPTNEPTTDPTEYPTQITPVPTQDPTLEPTLNPIVNRRRLLSHYDSTLYFKTNVIAIFLCDTRYTSDPTEHPTLDPTAEASTTPIITTSLLKSTMDIDEGTPLISSKAYTIILISLGALFVCCMLGGFLYYCTSQQTSATSPAHDSVEMKGELFDDPQAPWKHKAMREWTNTETLNWVKTLSLGIQNKNKILDEIKGLCIIGEDLCELRSAQEVADAFDIINDRTLCNALLVEIQKFKPINDGFRMKLNVSGRDIMLDQEIHNNDTVQFVKSLFKIQMELDVDVEHIHLKYKNKELSSHKTMKQCDVKSSNDLVTVEMDDVFSININSQQNNMVLNKKVTKKCSIQQLTQMYKSQSGVRADIDDIHFYYKGKVLEPYRTLEQCGIVDERHLISVKFGADAAEYYD